MDAEPVTQMSFEQAKAKAMDAPKELEALACAILLHVGFVLDALRLR